MLSIICLKPAPPKRQFNNRVSPELSTISEETSGCLSRKSSMLRNDDIEEYNEEEAIPFEPRRSLKCIPSDVRISGF